MKPITRFVLKLGIPMVMFVAGATYLGKAYPCSPGGEVQNQPYFRDKGYLPETQLISGMPSRYQTGTIVNPQFPDVVESFPQKVTLFKINNRDINQPQEEVVLYQLREGRGTIIGSLLQDIDEDGDLDLFIIEASKSGKNGEQRVRCLENITKGN